MPLLLSFVYLYARLGDMTRIDAAWIMLGIVLVAGGLTLAFLGFGGAVIVAEFIIILLGTWLYGVGVRHWRISRR
jgi:hypothetical protein